MAATLASSFRITKLEEARAAPNKPLRRLTVSAQRLVREVEAPRRKKKRREV